METDAHDHDEYCGTDLASREIGVVVDDVCGDVSSTRGGAEALVPPTHPDCSGHVPEMERISRGSQIRSASGQKWAHLTLPKLLQIRCDPEVATVMEELATLTESRFSSNEVRQKGEKQDDFKAKLARAIELMRVLTAHYSDWRAAFAAF